MTELLQCLPSPSQRTLSGQCPLASVLGGALHNCIAHLDGSMRADLLPGMGRAQPAGQRMKLERCQAP